ncbi:MAG: phage tail protein [Rhodobacteraceae bacterium]|nr:phage tail protein [Paracoccaceae bacterium]MBR9823745.1 phage tail protein [Paracoccaceae bacterium]
MKKLQVVDGVVVNVVEIDPDAIPDWVDGWPDHAPGIDIGWLQDEAGDFVPPSTAAPAASQLWAEVRRRRNDLLTACDWTQLPDVSVTEAERSAWQVYRQALRDITEAEDPAALSWPTPPA